jgi:hypothetical protein
MLEKKFNLHQQYMKNLIKERENKDNKLTEVTKELEKLKAQLNEKEKKIENLEKENEKKANSNNDLIYIPGVGPELKYFNNKLKSFDDEIIFQEQQNLKNKIEAEVRTSGVSKGTRGSGVIYGISRKMSAKYKPTKISLLSTPSENYYNFNEKLLTYRPPSPKPYKKTDKIEPAESNRRKSNEGVIANHLNEIYNKKAKELANKMKKNLNSKTNNLSNANKRSSNNKSLSLSCVSINDEAEGFISGLDIVEYMDNNSNRARQGKNSRKLFNNNQTSCDGGVGSNMFNKHTQKLIDENSIEFNKEDLSSPRAYMKPSQRINFPTAPAYKNNINRFLNNINSGGNGNTIISSPLILSSKDKPIQVSQRDASPTTLQQARLERQLIAKEKADVPNIIISKTAFDFVNEYFSKKNLKSEECKEMAKNENNKVNNLEAINSIINFTSSESNNNIKKNDENEELHLQNDIYKSLNELNEIKKNLKFSKFMSGSERYNNES